MKVIRSSLFALALTACAGGAFAQSNPSAANAQRCQALSQEVQAEFQKSVQARVPKTDPTSFNQDGYDIKGIMSQDVTSGMGKLMSLDFSGIINSVVNKGLTAASQRATANFSQRMNGVLSGVGVPAMNFQASTSGVSAPVVSNVPQGLSSTLTTNAQQVVNNGLKKVAGPYGRP